MKIMLCFIFYLAALTPVQALLPWRGEQRVLILLLEWKDNERHTPTRWHIQQSFFGHNNLSLKRYFKENAHTTFSISGEVAAWREAPLMWSESLVCDSQKILSIATTLFADKLKSIWAFDSDKNGKIDNLFVVHTGVDGQRRIGPECLFAFEPKADFAITLSYSSLGRPHFGSYIHEAGHAYYDLPDLYGNHLHGNYGIGIWGIMGLGSWGVNAAIDRSEIFTLPGHFSPLSKFQIGWVIPKVVTSELKGVKLKAVESSGEVLAIPLGMGHNYFLEYRSKQGFSADHPGHGLLIWNNHALIQADGRGDLSHGNDLGMRPLPPTKENLGDATDPFPTKNVDFYNDKRAGVSFTNIKRGQGYIQLDILFSPYYRYLGVPPSIDLISVLSDIF